MIVAAAGSRDNRQGGARCPPLDVPRGPAGARAYAEALERLGVEVTRFRRRSIELAGIRASGLAYAAVDPSAALSPLEAIRVRELGARGAELLLVGDGSAAAMRCYGFETGFSGAERAIVERDTLRIGAVLAPAAPRPARRACSTMQRWPVPSYRRRDRHAAR